MDPAGCTSTRPGQRNLADEWPHSVLRPVKERLKDISATYGLNLASPRQGPVSGIGLCSGRSFPGRRPARPTLP
jgi:hypothetical protein